MLSWKIYLKNNTLDRNIYCQKDKVVSIKLNLQTTIFEIYWHSSDQNPVKVVKAKERANADTLMVEKGGNLVKLLSYTNLFCHFAECMPR